MKKSNLYSIILYISILAFVFWLIFTIFGGIGNKVAYSEVVKLLENEQVKSFVGEVVTMR